MKVFKKRVVFTAAVIITSTFILKVIFSRDACLFSDLKIDTTFMKSTFGQDLCIVTRQTEDLRIQHNNQNINPSETVIDELLQITSNLPNLCKIKGNLTKARLLVVLVETERKNWAYRDLIRRTWGSLRRHKHWHIRVVFLMGQSLLCLVQNDISQGSQDCLEKEEAFLRNEHLLYQDTLFGAFTDTYDNLTYKTLLGYKFVEDNCPKADFVVKVDDDVFVHIPGILNTRDEDVAQNGNLVNDIYCSRYATDFKPIRCSFCSYGKYYTSPEEWPEDNYPPFCVGGGYAISAEWVKLIFSVRRNAGFYKLEDVFVTGKMRRIAEKEYKKVANVVDLNSTRSSNSDSTRNSRCDESLNHFVYMSRNSFRFERSWNCLWELSKELVVDYG